MFSFLYRWADNLRHRRRKRVWNPDHASGRRGEDLAHRYLQKKGYVVVARNFRLRSGAPELDIVAWEGETLVIVEVKSRTSEEYGTPDRAIDGFKRDRLFRGAREYARRAGMDWSRVRFDIINVLLKETPVITHLRDVFPLTTAV